MATRNKKPYRIAPKPSRKPATKTLSATRKKQISASATKAFKVPSTSSIVKLPKIAKVKK